MPAPTAFHVDRLDASPIPLRGWRVVRTLGSSAVATTALVARARVQPVDSPRVLRLFTDLAPDVLIDGEVAVHDALAHVVAEDDDEGHPSRTQSAAVRQHWVRAESLVSADDGRLGLLFEAVHGPTAATWLDEREPLELGHVVTMLAPIADAVRQAHDHGVMGIVPDLHGMRIDAAGTPIIVRLHNALARPALPERFRRADALHEQDRHALARLVLAVAGHVAASSQQRVLKLASVALDGAPSLWEALVHEARPQPLNALARRQHDRPTADPIMPTAEPQPLESSRNGVDDGLSLRSRLSDMLASWGLPESLRASVDAAYSRVQSTSQMWAKTLRGVAPRGAPKVRPKFLALGAAGVLAVVLAVVSLNGADRDTRTSNSGSLADSDAGVETHVQPTPSSSATASETHDAPESLEHPEVDEWNSLVQLLLERWSACRALHGEGCSQTVAHPRSAAELLLAVDDERHGTIDAWLVGERELVVVEQMGAAVLVDLIEAQRTTASLLLMRSEAGWRVRDVLG